jgi:hypothetical protein
MSSLIQEGPRNVPGIKVSDAVGPASGPASGAYQAESLASSPTTRDEFFAEKLGLANTTQNTEPILKEMPRPHESELVSGIRLPRIDELQGGAHKVREILDKAFEDLCNLVEPVQDRLRSLYFHGTSVRSAEEIQDGALPRRSDSGGLWCAVVDRLAPTVELLTRDFLNAIQTAAGYTGTRNGESIRNGALLIIKNPRCELLEPAPFIPRGNYCLDEIVWGNTEAVRGRNAFKRDCGGDFQEPGSLRDHIKEVVCWIDTPYSDAKDSFFTRETRAMYVLERLLRDFEESPLNAGMRLREDPREFFERYYPRQPDGTLRGETPRAEIIIEGDRVTENRKSLTIQPVRSQPIVDREAVRRILAEIRASKRESE